jgi:hypothetical protein
MTHRGVWAFLFLAVALVAAAPASAQIQSVDTSQPIPIKAAKPLKPIKFAGAVVSSNAKSITVRSSDNPRVVRTFTFGPKIQAKMLQIAQQGGYRFGDQVQIMSAPGSDVAQRVKGKP